MPTVIPISYIHLFTKQFLKCKFGQFFKCSGGFFKLDENKTLFIKITIICSYKQVIFQFFMTFRLTYVFLSLGSCTKFSKEPGNDTHLWYSDDWKKMYYIVHSKLESMAISAQ